MFSNQDLKKLIVPLVIEQALVLMVGMVDTMMIASLGEAAMSGVSLVDMINGLLINVFAALSTGGAVVVSQYIGAKKQKEANASTTQLIFVALAVSLVVMVVCLWQHSAIIRLFFGSIEDDVMASCQSYFFITSLSFPFLSVISACAAVFRSIGRSKVTMYASLLSNALNVVGNAIFIYVIPFGVAGAAGATVFSRFAAMLMLLVLLTNKRNMVFIDFKQKFRLQWDVVKRILYVGIPSGIENSLFSLGRVMVVGFISTFGTVQIAANAVANNLDGLGCVPGGALNLAMITVAGQCIGAGDLGQTKYYIKKLMKITHLLHFGWNMFLFVLLPFILGFYNLSPETHSLTWILIGIHNGIGSFLWPVSFTLPNALRAGNDVRYTMVVAVSSMFAFRILFSYVLGIVLGLGAIGVWIAMILDWICRIICWLLRYKSGKWLKYKAD
ncbi:MAG: MATE family efflux transporter [Clostridia bacterium]|nr:MATE family efflux transporter [Clostridia bacterium]